MWEDARKLFNFLAYYLRLIFQKNMSVQNVITLTRPCVQNDRVNNQALPQARLPRHRLQRLHLLL